MFSHTCLILNLLCASINARQPRPNTDLGFGDDADLTKYVTRPEIKAPLFNVTRFEPDLVTPGFWFLAPYASVTQETHPRGFYQACSTGPSIYDNNGELVWSGACIVRNQNACDFRAFQDENGRDFQSWVFGGNDYAIGKKGTIVDNSYNLATARNATLPPLEDNFNMHEYKVIDHGRSALYIVVQSKRVELKGSSDTLPLVGWVTNSGIREIDTTTGAVLFEWLCLDQERVSIWESSLSVDARDVRGPLPWNWMHPNSIDKSPEGDYLFSGRFVDTIYKVSGKDGSVLWRLGGRSSDFKLDGFTFSKQHDARFMSYDPVTGIETISLFDNAQAFQQGWTSESTNNVSSCLVVELDRRSWTARVLRRIDRPDGGLTALRGNFQTLPNGNAICSWSENAYVTEHGPDGQLVAEGRFTSRRFVTYRAYKMNFTGFPTEPPVLKVFLFGETVESSTTVCYVSWNGATTVARWSFYSSGDMEGNGAVLMGSETKIGFETVFQSAGAEEYVYAEAIAQDGSTIGKTSVQRVTFPEEWTFDRDDLQSQDDIRGIKQEL